MARHYNESSANGSSIGNMGAQHLMTHFIFHISHVTCDFLLGFVFSRPWTSATSNAGIRRYVAFCERARLTHLRFWVWHLISFCSVNVTGVCFTGLSRNAERVSTTNRDGLWEAAKGHACLGGCSGSGGRPRKSERRLFWRPMPHIEI